MLAAAPDSDDPALLVAAALISGDRSWLDRGAAKADLSRDRQLVALADSYLRSDLDRFDALSYLYLSRVMDYFDPFADPEAVKRIAAAGTQALVVSFDTDWRFSTAHSRRIVRTLEHGRVPVTFREIRSPWGHDSFLLSPPGYHDTVSAFLDRAYDERGQRAA